MNKGTESVQASIVYAWADPLGKSLPVARFVQQFLHLSFPIMIVKEQFVE